MKNPPKEVLSAVLVLLTVSLLLFNSCEDTGTGDGNTVTNPNVDASVLVTDAMKGAPVFNNSAARVTISNYGTLTDYGATPDSTGFKGIYSTFKEYDPAGGSSVDQGVDGSNLWFSLYSNLADIEMMIDNTTEDLSFAATAVEPPVNLNADRSGPYTMGIESVDSSSGISKWAAANISDTATELLYSYKMSSTSQNSAGVNYVDYDSASGDMLLDISYLVDYSDTNEIYAPRLWVNGSTTDNSFEVLAANYGYYDHGSLYPDGIMETLWSLAGAGINSTGGYMIFYYTSQVRYLPDSTPDTWSTWEDRLVNDSNPYPLTGWYRIEAGAAEADFGSLYWYDTLADLVNYAGDSEDYGSLVTALSDATTGTMFTTDDLDGTADARMVTILDDFGTGALNLP